MGPKFASLAAGVSALELGFAAADGDADGIAGELGLGLGLGLDGGMASVGGAGGVASVSAVPFTAMTMYGRV